MRTGPTNVPVGVVSLLQDRASVDVAIAAFARDSIL
jgi:hypothetical protein